MEAAKPTREHELLKQLVGDWTYENECVMGPDQPPMKSSGTASNSLLGELWLLGKWEGEGPGGDLHTMLSTIGYDPAKQRVVGSFIGTPMAMMWLYDGEWDAAGKLLTLNADGPSFTGDGTTAHYQDIYEVTGQDQHTLRSQVEGPDGTWTQFMTMRFSRAKK
jgi:hypothetical protein